MAPVVDYKPIFASAKKSAVEWYYVEQEPPFVEVPAMEATKVDYEYLHGMDRSTGEALGSVGWR